MGRIVAGAGTLLTMRSTFDWLFRRRRAHSGLEPMAEVGQPPADAEPIVEPRMQDIGSGSYELPLPGGMIAEDSHPGAESD